MAGTLPQLVSFENATLYQYYRISTLSADGTTLNSNPSWGFTEPGGGKYTGLSQVQLLVIPEPAALALLGLSGLALLPRRRKV